MDIKTQIETLLSSFWDKRAQDIIDDPLSTVGIDKLVQRKLPVELIIRHGGYNSKVQFITEITDKVLRHLKEQPK
jgi:hypothetical protein